MKAMLVIDMPKDCNHCPFSDFINGQWECNQNKGVLIANAMKTCSVSSWCPLKPMPERKDTSNRKITYEELRERIGWNACLEEIEK